MSDPIEWDPLPGEREYFRSRSTGDRGYKVIREKKDCIRLDRPMQEICFPKTDDWLADEYGSLLLPTQAAMIAFAADRAVCQAIGLHMESRIGWQDMTDRKRIAFLQQGPGEEAAPMRKDVYKAIQQAMLPYTR